MPAFNPLAGFSPNCWAVRVQMEHCAVLSAGRCSNKMRENIKTVNHFFIPALFVQRYYSGTIRDAFVIRTGGYCNFPFLPGYLIRINR